MGKGITFLYVTFFLIGCSQSQSVHRLYGYIVYILPDNVKFVETKRRPDINYRDNFSNNNFKYAISFGPNCEIKKLIENIKVDTLFDENPKLSEYTTFMKQPLIFPAEIIIADTANNQVEMQSKKFKMILNRKEIEFKYSELKSGVVINLIRLN